MLAGANAHRKVSHSIKNRCTADAGCRTTLLACIQPCSCQRNTINIHNSVKSGVDLSFPLRINNRRT